MKYPYDRNVPYNQLPLLPPGEDSFLNIRVLQSLNQANKALAELKGLAQKLPNQSMLVNTIALREAKASTGIENIFTTDDELYKALNDNARVVNPNTKEVIRYRQAIWTGYEFLVNDSEISIPLILNVYQQIKEVKDGIRPDQTETIIKKSGSGLLSQNIVYTPPRGTKVITQKLENLILYLNDDDRYPADPLIKMAVAHYQFEAIHPFRDGNGRTGRILNILYLIQKELIHTPIVYLSAYIIRNKEDYHELLNKVTARNNWTEWILYILKAVEETSIYTIQKVNAIDNLFQMTWELSQNKLPHLHKEVIEKIFEQPYISAKSLLSPSIKSLNTAKKYLQQLVDIKILVPEKVGKEVIYLNIDLFNFLSET